MLDRLGDEQREVGGGNRRETKARVVFRPYFGEQKREVRTIGYRTFEKPLDEIARVPATTVPRLREHGADADHLNRPAIEGCVEAIYLGAGQNLCAIRQRPAAQVFGAPRCLELRGVEAPIGGMAEPLVPDVERRVDHLLEQRALGRDEVSHGSRRRSRA